MNIPKYDEEAAIDKPMPLRALSNVGGHATIFMGGVSPCFVFKGASTSPHIISLRDQAVRSLTSFNTIECEAGFAYVDLDVSQAPGALPS